MIALVEEALDAIQSTDLARRALLTSALVRELTWSAPQRARRLALADEALDLAQQCGEDRVLVQVLAEQVNGYDHTDGQVIRRFVDQAADMVRIATAIDEPIALFDAYMQRIHGSIFEGDRATLDASIDAAEALAARLRRPQLEARARVMRTAQTLVSGRLDQAERQIAAIGEYVAVHRLVEQNSVATMTFQLYYERGRLAELEPLLSQMVTDNPLIVAWRVALLTAYTATDRFDDAREHLSALAADDFAMVPRDNLWVPAMMGIASAAGDAGELDIAEQAYNYMLPFRGIIILTGSSAVLPAGLSLGIAAAALGRFDDARELHAEGLDLAERFGAPTFVATGRARLAQTLLDANRPDDVARAKELARLALATAEDLGLGRTAELSRRVLSA